MSGVGVSLIKGLRIGLKDIWGGTGIQIYNGNEIPESPFNSYREGGKAIDLKSVSTIKFYIDTNKVYPIP